jgi:hypothetical protein
MAFNIGVTCIGYNCKEGLEEVLRPWKQIKTSPELAPLVGGLSIAFVHGCFEETHAIGFPLKSEDGTEEYADEIFHKGVLDEVGGRNEPRKEYEMWTEGYELSQRYSKTFLNKDIDLLWMLNTDEVWTIDEINKVLSYIKLNNLVDFYKVNFKNYCIDKSTWVDDFIVPRIWWAKKQGGLKRFYQDDLVEYNNGKKDIVCSHLVIPQAVAFPKHYSWVGSKEYLQRKLAFQKLRYGQCSYRWNEAENKLELNDDYYKAVGKPKPTLYKDTYV